MKFVLITAGPEKAKHYVHSQLLCEKSGFFRAAINSEKSGFFRAAINSGFKKSSEQVIDLPEETAEQVDNFIDWLYREKLPELSAKTLNNTESIERDDDLIDNTNRLCYQFIFADKYDIPRLRKCALLDLVKLVNRCRAPGSQMIAGYYKATGKKSPLRRLLCDWYTLRVTPKFFEREDYQDGFSKNPEWAADLLAACSRNWLLPSVKLAEVMIKAEDYL